MDGPSTSRQGMTVRIYPSNEAQSKADASYWADLPAGVRVLQVWKLSEEQWRLRGEYPHEPGLSRSVASLRRP